MKKVFWLAGGNMNKFHAFYQSNLRSLCMEWVRQGTIAKGIKWSRSKNKQDQKCKECLKAFSTSGGNGNQT
jgi:hypothetical protein